MTFGIGAFGPGAGAAILAAWAEAERGVTGDVGGFAVLAALRPGSGPVSVECQRGGLATIRAEWGGTGLLDLMQRAPVAALITSGPDRAVPLSQFLPAGRAGLVTGHRRPDHAGVDGVPVNVVVLRLLSAGVMPAEAVRRVTEANPDLDAGLIAVTEGEVALADTARVRARTDRGEALLRGLGRGIAVLHNSVIPSEGLAVRVARAGFAGFS